MIQINKKIIISIIIAGLILPNFGLAQNLPENTDQLKQAGGRVLETAQKELPGIFVKIFKEEVWPVWQKMFGWFKTNIWPKIWPPARRELEKRKEIFKQEFPAEKQEVKEEAPGLIKSLWKKFKDIMK